MEDQSNNAPLTANPTGIPHGDDIAIVGFSFKLPQGVEDVDSFWEVLRERRNLMTAWPETRKNAEAFVTGKKSKVCRFGVVNEGVS